MQSLDVQTTALFFALQNEAKRLGIKRINSVMVLKGLLEAEVSPIYNAIFTQLDPHQYPDFIDQCYVSYFYKNTANVANKELSLGEKIKSKIYHVVNEPKILYPRISCIYGGKKVEFDFDIDMRQVLIVLDEKTVKANILDLTKALVEVMPSKVLKIFRTFGLNIRLIKEQVSNLNLNQTQNSSNATIPEELESFVTDLNEKFKDKKCDISGRDKECALVWQTLQKQTKRNVVLVGEPGVGKTSIVEKVTCDILSGNCPEEFKNSRVLVLDVNSSVAGTMYRGQSEERYSELAKFLENTPDVILFIDEIHLIRGAGACRDGEADLSNAIKPILAGSKVRVIGATTNDEYEKYFSQDGAIKRRFRPIEVKEPKSSEVYSMLKKSIDTLSKYHGVTISEEMVEFIILNSSCYNYETKNPDRTKDLIDLSMVVAKQQGKLEVDKECVLANFKYNIEQFNQMPLSTKKMIAYHEAGHCILTMCSPYLRDRKVLAVSIMPADSYLGVTVIETNEEHIGDATMEYHLDSIAMCLAGRVAESVYTDKISSGARSDLEDATKEAHALISRYGMTEFGANRVILAEVNSQKVMNKVNREIDKIIKKAMKRAEKVIFENYDILITLVDELVKNGIVSEKDLERIFKDKK